MLSPRRWVCVGRYRIIGVEMSNTALVWLPTVGQVSGIPVTSGSPGARHPSSMCSTSPAARSALRMPSGILDGLPEPEQPEQRSMHRIEPPHNPPKRLALGKPGQVHRQFELDPVVEERVHRPIEVLTNYRERGSVGSMAVLFAFGPASCLASRWKERKIWQRK